MNPLWRMYFTMPPVDHALTIGERGAKRLSDNSSLCTAVLGSCPSDYHT